MLVGTFPNAEIQIVGHSGSFAFGWTIEKLRFIENQGPLTDLFHPQVEKIDGPAGFSPFRAFYFLSIPRL